ncbi:MAG: hypothetical protein WC788_06280 [Candidatus Paceibacterota bacterium]|jgi:predicted transcriptional regulator of viral defense system
MNYNDFEKISQKFLVFSKNTLRSLESDPESLNANIKYWLKNGKLIGLKNGLYVLSDRFRMEGDKNSYLEYIANQMVMPSYLSMEYTLSKYQILSEPANALTSMTVKTGREIVNKLGSFRYYSISPKLFCGYSVKYFQGAPVLEAEKAKALFDFLYLRFLSKREINREALEDLRLNWENISASDIKKMEEYIKICNNKRMNTLFKLINEQYYA